MPLDCSYTFCNGLTAMIEQRLYYPHLLEDRARFRAPVQRDGTRRIYGLLRDLAPSTKRERR